MPKSYTTIEEVVIDCISIQDACNLQAVLNTWAAMQSAIRSDSGDAESYLQHPANVLMMSKIASLMIVNANYIGGVSFGGRDLFSGAYKWARSLTGRE